MLAGAAFAAEVNGGLMLHGDAVTFKTADKSVKVASPTDVWSRGSGINVSSERAGLSLSFESANDASGYNLWVKPVDALKMSFVKSYGSTSFGLDFTADGLGIGGSIGSTIYETVSAAEPKWSSYVSYGADFGSVKVSVGHKSLNDWYTVDNGSYGNHQRALAADVDLKLVDDLTTKLTAGLYVDEDKISTVIVPVELGYKVNDLSFGAKLVPTYFKEAYALSLNGPAGKAESFGMPVILDFSTPVSDLTLAVQLRANDVTAFADQGISGTVEVSGAVDAFNYTVGVSGAYATASKVTLTVPVTVSYNF